MRSDDLERVALRLARVLGEKDCLLVGGLAVGAHGFVRATDDVDFVARSPLTEVRRRLEQHGIEAVLTRGDVLGGDFPCVEGTLNGVKFDVLPPLVPLDWDRAVELPMTGKAVLRVVDLEGLIRLKLRAQAPQDLMDVAALVLQHPEHRAKALEVAAAYGVSDKLELWLNDPRLKAKATGRSRRISQPAGRRRKRPS